MLFMLNLCKIYLLCVLCSCMGGGKFDSENLLKPGGRFMSYMPQNGSDAYQQGWMDGCESGLSIFTHTFQKHFYRYKKDQRFYGMKFGDERDLFNGRQVTTKDEKEYTVAWGATYQWCRHVMLGTQVGGSNQMRPNIYGDNLLGQFGKLHGVQHIYELQGYGNTTTSGWYANW